MHTETEVDFVHLAKTIWKRKLLVAKLTGIAAVVGFLISIMLPDKYTASITFVQQVADPGTRLNDEKLSAISALAAVADVDLYGVTNARMSAKTFSTILTSVPFRQELMKAKLNFRQTEAATTLYDYCTKQINGHPLVNAIYSMPDRILNALKQESISSDRHLNDQNLPRLTREEMEIYKILDKQVSLQLHDDEYVTIQCTLPEAYAAAQLTLSAERLLERYLTEIQTEKARGNLKFIQDRFDEAKTNFLKVREELDDTTVKSDVSRYSASCRIAEGVYSDLSRKLEQSKIALQEQTPIFKIINPVTLPTGKSSPDRIKITAICSFFGFTLAVILILGKGFFEETKEKWKTN